MRKFKVTPIIVNVMVFCCMSLSAMADKGIRIVSSAETHALLEACDCPQEPGGGFPKRAHLLNDMRSESDLLLLDAGGFAGGGMYDFYTEGRARDSVRTLAALYSMAYMGYDAVAIGDDELQYSVRWLVEHAKRAGLPLVSANCFRTDGLPITEQYRLIKKQDITFAITALSPVEKLFPTDSCAVIADPVKTLKELWPGIVKASDYQIILSHLGEEYLEDLARNFPECDVIVNGHRKQSADPVQRVENLYVMQFGFQGKKLSSLGFNKAKKSFTPRPWLEISPSIIDDTALVSLVSSFENNALEKSTVLDLYIMSQCPYGIPALRDVHSFCERFPGMSLNVWFIGDIKDDGSLKSLHGKGEIEEEKKWLAIMRCYPQMWDNFIFLRTHENLSTADAIADLELDTALIGFWAGGDNGDRMLRVHYQRSNRLRISASPTLTINNTPFQSELSFNRLAKEFCDPDTIRNQPGLCDSLPECFTDSDCRRKGKVGICVKQPEADGGMCEFKDDVSFDFVIVVADSPLVHTETQIIATTEELFPAVQINIYPMSSAQGKRFIEQFRPDNLPLYLFGDRVRNAVRFSEVEPGLTDKGTWFTFKDGVMKKHYFYARKETAGSVLYIDPLFPDVNTIVQTVLQADARNGLITIKPLIFEKEVSEKTTSEERMRREEALRWLVLLKCYGVKQFTEYLKKYGLKPGSSYWFSYLKEIRINSDKFVKAVAKNESLLNKLYEDLVLLDIRGPAEVLVHNREIVSVKNKSQLEKLVKAIVPLP